MHRIFIFLFAWTALVFPQLAMARAIDTSFAPVPFATEQTIQNYGLSVKRTANIKILHFRSSVPGLFHRKEYVCDEDWNTLYLVTFGNYTADTVAGHQLSSVECLSAVTRVGHWRATGGSKGLPTHWCDLYYKEGKLERAIERENERFVIPTARCR